MCEDAKLYKRVSLESNHGTISTEWVPFELAIIGRKLQFLNFNGEWNSTITWTVKSVINNNPVTEYVRNYEN